MVAAANPPSTRRMPVKLRRALSTIAALLLGFVLWPYWQVNLVTARLLLSTLDTGSADIVLEQFYPGIPGAVRLLAASEARIWSLPRDDSPLLQQRYVEMLYPREVRPYDIATLRAGDLIALDPGRQLPVPTDEVYVAGLARIVRVRQ